MKILHLLSGGGIGGIEMLCRDIAEFSEDTNEFCFLYRGGVIADSIQKKGAPTYFFYKKVLLGRVMKLLWLVHKKKYDVIIVHHEGIGIYSFYLILRFFFGKIGFIKYLHCPFEKKYFYTGQKLLDKLNYNILKATIRKSNILIAVSGFVKESYIQEFECRSDQIRVNYNGIQRETHIERQMIDEGHTVRLLYIGRLVEVKGITLLLRAVKQLFDEGISLELEIIGDGAMRADYEKTVVELGIEKMVFFRGYDLNKQKYYDETQIFVYPSIWQEAFGISIVEAMEHGLICVASNTGGIPEIITNDIDGFLFENKNIDHMVYVLHKAIEMCKTKKYIRMSEAARKRAENFDIGKTINRLRNICADVVKNKHV